RPNPYQPRHAFNDEELRDLADSIRNFGIIQPISVSKVMRETPSGTEVEYQLIAGERRLKASKLVGLERIPAIVKEVDTHQSKLELSLIENIQRSDLNPLETARAYARLQEEFGLTQREVAERVGKSRESVANTLRLLNLPLPIQDALARRALNESQARMLLSFPDAASQLRAFGELIAAKTSGPLLRESAAKHRGSETDPETSYWTRKLEEDIGAPVKVVRRGGKGKIVIQFFSDDEWRAIIERLVGSDER
ncbi:MAG: ParB/RepB/Spo0J family partition protein, partial [Patescibacteria group bacterium]